MSVTIGIDATNLRVGGGVTHLIELLRAAQPLEVGVERVVVWGGTQILALLDERPWLVKRNPPALEKGLLQRVFWQRFSLSESARREKCDVLFVPGGSYVGNFHPVVTMSQSLLPFDMIELRRYGWTPFALKLLLLRAAQSRSFKRADGVIFLTEYARDVVLSVTGKLNARTSIIAHGVNSRFKREAKRQRAVGDCDASNPFHILYVSTIDRYKHQWHVVEAVAALREKGLPVVLDLVGPAHGGSLRRLECTLDRLDAGRVWGRYHGAAPYETLHAMYGQADLGICASTCETFGLMLIESMVAGLPIACSDKQPMKGIVGEGGIYFNPENPEDIARVLAGALASPSLRENMAQASFIRAQQYSWQNCAERTFSFLIDIVQRKKGTADVRG